MKKFIILMLFALFAVHSSEAQIPERMNLQGLINDYAGVLSAEQERVFEATLANIHSTFDIPIVIVTMTDLKGLDGYQMALGILNGWEVGQNADFDGGVVIVLKPRTETDGEIAIVCGSDLSTVMNEEAIERIIDNAMFPYLLTGIYYDALVAAAYKFTEEVYVNFYKE